MYVCMYTVCRQTGLAATLDFVCSLGSHTPILHTPLHYPQLRHAGKRKKGIIKQKDGGLVLGAERVWPLGGAEGRGDIITLTFSFEGKKAKMDGLVQIRRVRSHEAGPMRSNDEICVPSVR